MDEPNVLLVVLDSVRARNVGLYGYHRDTTPFLTEYADRATVYRQARSPGIHSVASHASLWTGAAVEEHRATRHEDRLRPGTTVWESLADEGYSTALFTTNPVVAHSSNLSEPFDDEFTDDFVDNSEKLFPDAHSPADVVKHEGVSGNLKRSLRDDRPVRSLLNGAHHFAEKKRGRLSDSVTSAELVEEFLEWRGCSDEPWAACINLMDAHFPYEPAEEYDRWGGARLAAIHADLEKPPANEFIGGRPWWQLEAFEHLYDGAIRELDEYLERIVTGLERRGEHDDTLVVVTSDHGEGFGEVSPLTGRTRLVDHSWGIHEAVTHVPLVVKYPGQSDRSVVEDAATLTRFRDTVDAAVDRVAPHDSFVPDGPVLSSTYRLRKEDALIFEGSDERATDYYGPWRAAYETADDAVYKYARRGDDSLVVRIPNAQESSSRRAEGARKVESAFDGVDPRDLTESDANEVSSGVEDRLTELGYLR